SAIRYSGIMERLEKLQYNLQDLGNINIERPKKSTQSTEGNLRNLEEVVNANTKLAEIVKEEVGLNRFPLVLGGDHSIAIGTLAGLASHYENLGVIWYDAHGDINTGETSPSGNIHGMPLAASLGIGHPKLTEILSAE